MKTEQTTVTVTIGDKEFSKSYDKTVYETAEDVLALMEKPETLKKMIADLNYGSDLKAKANVRNSILSEQAGPEKAIDKMVKSLMAAREAVGKPITLEKAQELVKMLQEAA